MHSSETRKASERVPDTGSDQHEGPPRTASESLLARSLRVPVFHKIVLANLGLLSIGIVGGILGIPRFSPSGEGLATAVLAVSLLVSATAVNVLLVRAALRPIHSLQETALLVEAGDETARAESTGVADRQIVGLVRVFNRMLDHQEALRLSERDRAGRVLKRMDEQNTRSSSELYDNLAQLLAGVLLRLRLLDRTPELQGPEWSAKDGKGRLILNEVRSQVLEALEGVRGIARRLHPPELRELGLGYALDALARSVTDQTGLFIEVHADHGLPPLTSDTRLAVFRVAEEALRNAAAHSDAQKTRLTLSHEGDRICLEIRDDGSGFDTVSAMRDKTGLGLASMIERAEQVGGTVQLESRMGGGTCVRLRAPLTLPTHDIPSASPRAQGHAPWSPTHDDA